MIYTLFFFALGSLSLQEAESLATRGQLDAAIAAYEDITNEHSFAGAEYNLGTLYLQRGDIGRAILHLERADALESDDDIAHNLSVARAARRDQIEGATDSAWLNARRADTFAVVFFWLGLVAAFALAVFSTLKEKRRWLIVAAVVAVASAVPITLVYYRGSRPRVVVLRQTKALVAPSAEAAVAFTAHAGLSGTVQDEEGAYYRIRLDNGVDAYVAKADLAVVAKTDETPTP